VLVNARVFVMIIKKLFRRPDTATVFPLICLGSRLPPSFRIRRQNGNFSITDGVRRVPFVVISRDSVENVSPPVCPLYPVPYIPARRYVGRLKNKNQKERSAIRIYGPSVKYSTTRQTVSHFSNVSSSYYLTPRFRYH